MNFGFVKKINEKMSVPEGSTPVDLSTENGRHTTRKFLNFVLEVDRIMSCNDEFRANWAEISDEEFAELLYGSTPQDNTASVYGGVLIGLSQSQPDAVNRLTGENQ